MISVTVSDGVAVAALGIALWSAFQTGRFNRRQNAFADTAERLNQMLIQKETVDAQQHLKADVLANFVKIGKGDYRLKVFNRGAGPARNVRLEELAGDLIGDRELNEKFPLPVLERQQGIDVMVFVSLGSSRRAHIKLIWDDDAGTDQQRELWLDAY